MNEFIGTDIMAIIDNVRKLTAQDLFLRVMSKDAAQKEAVRLNVSQMKDKYINSEGVQLSDIGGDYSPYTMSKGKKSAPGNVDLHDTGKFHDSGRVENVTKTGFDIVFDSIKDGVDLKIEWGPEIEGLTVESQMELAAFLWGLFGEEILTSIAA